MERPAASFGTRQGDAEPSIYHRLQLQQQSYQGQYPDVWLDGDITPLWQGDW